MGRQRPKKSNGSFKESAYLNSATYLDYFERLKKVAVSMFKWKNLPDSMNERWLELCLFYDGKAGFLYDDVYGFINTKATSGGQINIYGLPTDLECFSVGEYSKMLKLYSGAETKDPTKFCILVMNNWDMVPTSSTIELFARRLYEAERTIDTNIKIQKAPFLISTDENQRLTLENLYSQVDGNRPVIFGDKNSGISYDSIKVLKTDAPYLADKLMDYKKQIWNEALTFLGISALDVEKKERLIESETSSNNEVTNLNLQASLIPRKHACEQFNKLFNLTGDKAVDVEVRSDLWNIIKQQMSVVSEFTDELGNNNIDSPADENKEEE